MIKVAIDGPSGAGKSTLARKAAEALGFIYVDTGAIYRTVGWAVLHDGLDGTNAAAVEALLPSLKIELVHVDGEQQVLLNGRNISALIRTPEVSMAASHCSALPCVRSFLLQMQRDMAERYNVVMDGRDIGTVVLPDADVKIFLTADVADRARRRFEELMSKAPDTRYEDVLAAVVQRDKQDSERAAAPLKAADDAVLLDTTGNTLEQSRALLEQTIREKLDLWA